MKTEALFQDIGILRFRGGDESAQFENKASMYLNVILLHIQLKE